MLASEGSVCTWDELVSEIQRSVRVRESGESWLQVQYSWTDGRQQVLDVTETQWGDEPIAMLTSPMVPYTEHNAIALLRESGLPLQLTQDAMLSVVLPVHIAHMGVAACLKVMAQVAELADEVEKALTGGADAQIPLRSETSGNSEVSETAEGALDDKVIRNGQWVVGPEVPPGYYRFAGYVARLDRQLGIITNGHVSSGLGLILIRPQDSYFEVNGEAIRLEDFPVYDIVASGARDGTYIAGRDIEYGTYRLHGDGAHAYYATYTRTMDMIRNDFNDNLIMVVDPTVFAVEIQGRLERLA